MRAAMSLLKGGGCQRKAKSPFNTNTSAEQYVYLAYAGKYSLLSRYLRMKEKPITQFTLTMFVSRCGFPVHLYQDVSQEKRTSFLNEVSAHYSDAIQKWVTGELLRKEETLDDHIIEKDLWPRAPNNVFDGTTVDRIKSLLQYTGSEDERIIESDQVYRSTVLRMDSVSYSTLDTPIDNKTLETLCSSTHTKRIFALLLYMKEMSNSSVWYETHAALDDRLARVASISQKLSPLDWALCPTEYEISAFSTVERYPLDTDVLYALFY